MRRELKGTLLIISHQERILEIADEIVVVAGGRIQAAGPRKEVLPQLLGNHQVCPSCPAMGRKE